MGAEKRGANRDLLKFGKVENYALEMYFENVRKRRAVYVRVLFSLPTKLVGRGVSPDWPEPVTPLSF